MLLQLMLSLQITTIFKLRLQTKAANKKYDEDLIILLTAIRKLALAQFIEYWSVRRQHHLHVSSLNWPRLELPSYFIDTKIAGVFVCLVNTLNRKHNKTHEYTSNRNIYCRNEFPQLCRALSFISLTLLTNLIILNTSYIFSNRL